MIAAKPPRAHTGILRVGPRHSDVTPKGEEKPKGLVGSSSVICPNCEDNVACHCEQWGEKS